MNAHPLFTCPKCGSHHWGSSRNVDGTWTRSCHGTDGSLPCLYTWHQDDDDAHGVAMPPDRGDLAHVQQNAR